VRPGVQDVTVTGRHARRISDIRIHRPRRIGLADITRIGVIPVTAPARTLLDLAATLTAPALEEAVDAALRRELVRVDRMLARLNSDETRGRRGRGRLRAFLCDRSSAGSTGSALETRFVRLLARAGLPKPIRQHELRDPDGTFIARVDFAYPKALIAIEVDGYAFHSGRNRWQADRTRQNRIADAGWLVLRFTDLDLRERPAEIVRIVATARARRLPAGLS
jgi:hypothetical protein